MALPSREEKFKNITLDDVSVAIEILEFYLQKLQRAKSVVARFGSMTGGRSGSGGIGGMGNMGFDDIVNMAVAVKQKEKGVATQEPEEAVITDEDITRMKATVAKVRGEKVATTQ